MPPLWASAWQMGGLAWTLTTTGGHGPHYKGATMLNLIEIQTNLEAAKECAYHAAFNQPIDIAKKYYSVIDKIQTALNYVASLEEHPKSDWSEFNETPSFKEEK